VGGALFALHGVAATMTEFAGNCPVTASTVSAVASVANRMPGAGPGQAVSSTDRDRFDYLPHGELRCVRSGGGGYRRPGTGDHQARREGYRREYLPGTLCRLDHGTHLSRSAGKRQRQPAGAS
jgi:hypothetical protein